MLHIIRLKLGTLFYFKENSLLLRYAEVGTVIVEVSLKLYFERGT